MQSNKRLIIGSRLRNQNGELESNLAFMTTERDRLGNLVSQMESSVSQDQANKALIADLKSEIEKHKGIKVVLLGRVLKTAQQH